MNLYLFWYLLIGRAVKTRYSIRSITVWPLSEPIQLGSLINEPKNFELGPTHHRLVG